MNEGNFIFLIRVANEEALNLGLAAVFFANDETYLNVPGPIFSCPSYSLTGKNKASKFNTRWNCPHSDE